MFDVRIFIKIEELGSVNVNLRFDVGIVIPIMDFILNCFERSCYSWIIVVELGWKLIYLSKRLFLEELLFEIFGKKYVS